MSKVKGSELQADKLGLRTPYAQFPLYLITCALEHGQTTRARFAGEFNVGNVKVNIQAYSNSVTFNM